MATQTALLLLILLIRATIGAPVNQPFHSPEDYAMMDNYVRREAPDPGSIGLLLPVSFTVSRPCLEAIVRELCGGVFYDPGPDELELRRRGNSNTFTCRGEECRLPNLTKYCDMTANITLEEFKSVQHSFGAMAEAPDFYSESIPQEEDGPLEMKNNFHTLYGKISDRFNVTRVRNIGPTCSQQFYCIVGDCCPTVPEVGCYTNRAAPLTTSTTTSTTPSPLLLGSNNNIMAVLRLLPTDNLSHAKRAEVAEMLLEQAYNSLKRKLATSTKRPRKGNRPPRRPRGRRRGKISGSASSKP